MRGSSYNTIMNSYTQLMRHFNNNNRIPRLCLVLLILSLIQSVIIIYNNKNSLNLLFQKNNLIRSQKWVHPKVKSKLHLKAYSQKVMPISKIYLKVQILYNSPQLKFKLTIDMPKWLILREQTSVLKKEKG